MLKWGSYHRPENKHKQEYALPDATHLKVFCFLKIGGFQLKHLSNYYDYLNFHLRITQRKNLIKLFILRLPQIFIFFTSPILNIIFTVSYFESFASLFCYKVTNFKFLMFFIIILSHFAKFAINQTSFLSLFSNDAP